MRRRGFRVLALAGLLGSAHMLASGQTTDARSFHARLSPVPIDLTMAKAIAGTGTVTAMLKGRTLVLTGKFAGLKSPATVARVHRGPNRGLRGGAIFDLMVSTATSGELSGTLELSAAQVEDLQKGRLYVQLHSQGAPEGNLWGWLLLKQPAH